MRKFILCLLVYLDFYSLTAFSLPKNCQNDCILPFGTKIGENSGVPAYSNCKPLCVNPEPHQEEALGQKNEKIYTGIKWQCVEYARRWLVKNKHVIFGSVDFAFEIFNLTHVTSVNNKDVKFCLKRFVNNQTSEYPQRGDLLIYGKEHFGTGHIAIIVGLGKNFVTVAEENYFNDKWHATNEYARKILLSNTQDKVRIHDTDVLGWMRVEK
ncbi:MAG: CHAP domain-containing protein [Silvanigrellaceae bacterium]|nr:CHAP domain-containing protein [Silvanigrellaceae bacterium]